jgi:hypothetical protein
MSIQASSTLVHVPACCQSHNMQVPTAVCVKLTFRERCHSFRQLFSCAPCFNRHTTELSLGFVHDMQSRMSTEDSIATDMTWCMQLSHIGISSYPNPNPFIEPEHLNHHHHHHLSSIVIDPVDASNKFLNLNAFVWTNGSFSQLSA